MKKKQNEFDLDSYLPVWQRYMSRLEPPKRPDVRNFRLRQAQRRSLRHGALSCLLMLALNAAIPFRQEEPSFYSTGGLAHTDAVTMVNQLLEAL